MWQCRSTNNQATDYEAVSCDNIQAAKPFSHFQGRGISPHAMLGDGDVEGDEDEEAFLDGEEDDVDDEEHLLLDGPDFNALDNAFQQGLEGEGLEGEPPENVCTPAA